MYSYFQIKIQTLTYKQGKLNNKKPGKESFLKYIKFI